MDQVDTKRLYCTEGACARRPTQNPKPLYQKGTTMLQEMEVNIKGVSQLLIHNGQTANPLNKFARQLKAVSGKRNKTDEDVEAMAKIEFMAGWYLGEKGEYTLPAHNIEAVMLEGAKKNKNGRLVQGGVFVESDPVLVFPGSDKTPEQLWERGENALMVSVRVQRNRVMRTRPIVPAGWTSKIVVKYDPTVIEEPAIRQAFSVAGRERGIGDWRPKYGRFVVD